MTKKVLIIGQGGREHAFAWKIAQSNLVNKIYVCPGNAGTSMLPKTENINIRATDIESLLEFAKNNQFSKFLCSPFINEISLIYKSKDECFFDSKTKYGEKIKKVFGCRLREKDYFTKTRYLSVLDQILTLFRLNIFFTITNHSNMTYKGI